MISLANLQIPIIREECAGEEKWTDGACCTWDLRGRENKGDETNRYDKLSCCPMDLIGSTMTRWYWLTRGESRGFITMTLSI